MAGAGNNELKIIAKKGNVLIDAEGGKVNLGSNTTRTLINDLPCCVVTGGKHCLKNTNVYV